LEDDIIHYRQRLNAAPNSHAFLPLAKAYTKAGRYREAEETCLRGLEKYPNYWAAQVVLGEAYLMQGMLDEALVQLEVVVREAANNLMASKLLGQIYIQQGRFEEAIERYRVILTYYPECIDLKEKLEHLEAEQRHQYEETLQVLQEWLSHIRACRRKAA
jgi:tetratricopeptide (TPR) repeat protein